MNIKDYIKINQELRSSTIKRRPDIITSKSTVSSASSDVALSGQINQAIFSPGSFSGTLASTLYNIPEIGICVDFWKDNIGSSRIMISARDETKSKEVKFAEALESYLNDYQMINGLPFRVLFNQNSLDYVLQGTEVYILSKKKVNLDKWYFPQALVPIKFADADISTEQDDFGYYTYTVKTKASEFNNDNIYICKRAACPADEFGTPVLFRALRPIQKQLTDNELDRSISKMGIASSFVLIKYGTEEEPRQDEDLQELYDEISNNIADGIGFGVVPPDVAVESLFKSSSVGQFSRDKIYEMYLESINYAFGGVLSAISPASNTGASSDRPLIILKNILQSERDARKDQIIDRMINYCALMNNIPAPTASLGDIKMVIQTESSIKLDEFDRGIISHETYLEDRFHQEVSRLRTEHSGYSDVVVPRDLPYTKSGGNTTENTKKSRENDENVPISGQNQPNNG